jgi:NAD+ kinase
LRLSAQGRFGLALTMQPIRRLAFLVNAQKRAANELARDLVAMAEGRGVAVVCSDQFPVPDGFLKGMDACCVIGGDGTLLSAVGEAAREQVPLIGVNRGSLGFLTTLSADEARHELPAILDGTYRIESRSLLEGSAGEERGIALNDILIKGAKQTRMVHLRVVADGEFVTDCFSDGMIFCTPTGSTAYNLSAGGPLVHPSIDVVTMTPICPHTLSNRSIIFRPDVSLRLESCIEGDELLVAMDGQRHLLRPVGPIEIRMAPQRLLLIQRNDHSHFRVLRSKLQWSGGHISTS